MADSKFRQNTSFSLNHIFHENAFCPICGTNLRGGVGLNFINNIYSIYIINVNTDKNELAHCEHR